MNRVGSAIAAMLLGVAVCLCLVASSDASLAAAAPPPELLRLNAVLDQQIVQVEMSPGAGEPSVQEPRAIELAESQTPASTHPTSIQSRYVSLTIRGSDGPVVRGIQSRMAWLITLNGVGYAPPGSATSVCNCSAAYARPNTLAALDAQTGDVIALMGVAN